MNDDDANVFAEYRPEYASTPQGSSGGIQLNLSRLGKPPGRKRKPKEEVKHRSPKPWHGKRLKIDTGLAQGAMCTATMPNTPLMDNSSVSSTSTDNMDRPPLSAPAALEGGNRGGEMFDWGLAMQSVDDIRRPESSVFQNTVFLDVVGSNVNEFATPSLWRSSITHELPTLPSFDLESTPMSNSSHSMSLSLSFQLGPSFEGPIQSTPAPGKRPSKKDSKPSKPEVVKKVLKELRDAGITPTEMLTIILDSANPDLTNWRNKFYEDANHQRIFSIFDKVKEHKKTSDAFETWVSAPALELVSRKVYEEVVAVKPKLYMETSELTMEWVDNWSLQEIMGPVSEETPTLTQIITVATSPKYRPLGAPKESGDEDDEDDREPDAEEGEGRNRPVARLILASQIHYLHSHFSCKVPLALGLVAWANGCPQVFNDLLHQAALVRCHSSNSKAIEIVGGEGIEMARKIAKGPHICAWDNVQVSTSIFVEQTDATRPKVQSGTFPVIYKPPPGATTEKMLLQPILDARRNAPDLSMGDLRASKAQRKLNRKNTRVNICKMLFKHVQGFGDAYAKLELMQNIPTIHRLKPGYRTECCPISLVPIEEASIKGNNLVIDNIWLGQLQMKIEELEKLAVISANDQLTNSRIRSCKIQRKSDHGGSFHNREFLELAIALFHMVLNLIWALKEKYYGSLSEVASLAQLFSLLDKARLARSKPDFHTLLATLIQIVEGLVLNAWEAECGHPTLEAFVKTKPTAEELLQLAETIIQQHATPTPSFTPAYVPRKPANQSSQPTPEPTTSTTPQPGPAIPDNVRENVIRLTRDLLLVVELVSAVKDGDFGRVEAVLPDLAFTFQGAGSNNYSTEILHLIHSFKHVWSKDFADIVRSTLIINISGNEGHGMGIDLNIEHLIRYLKALFVSKGIYSKWDRAKHISASINLVMVLKQRVSRSLRLRYQGSTHTQAKTTALVERIQTKAKELELHKVVLNRSGTSPLRPDLRAVGRQRMESGSLAAFNAKLQDAKSRNAVVADDTDIVVDQEVDEIGEPTFDMDSHYEQLP